MCIENYGKQGIINGIQNKIVYLCLLDIKHFSTIMYIYKPCDSNKPLSVFEQSKPFNQYCHIKCLNISQHFFCLQF